MEKLAHSTGNSSGVSACHDVTATRELFVHSVRIAGLIQLVLLSEAVIRDELHGDLIEPAILNKLVVPCFLFRSHTGNHVRVIFNKSVVAYIPDITAHKLKRFWHSVCYSQRIALKHIPMRKIKPSGDIILFSLFRGNAGVKQVSERAQAAADRLVPALIRVHKALVGLVAQQLGNVALYLLLIEVAYRADDITLKLRAGVLHDGSTGNGIIQAEHRGVGAQPAGCCLPCLDVLVGQVGSVHLALEPGEHTQIVLPLSSELTGESLVLILLGGHLSEGIRVHAVNLL